MRRDWNCTCYEGGGGYEGNDHKVDVARLVDKINTGKSVGQDDLSVNKRYAFI